MYSTTVELEDTKRSGWLGVGMMQPPPGAGIMYYVCTAPIDSPLNPCEVLRYIGVESSSAHSVIFLSSASTQQLLQLQSLHQHSFKSDLILFELFYQQPNNLKPPSKCTLPLPSSLSSLLRLLPRPLWLPLLLPSLLPVPVSSNPFSRSSVHDSSQLT